MHFECVRNAFDEKLCKSTADILFNSGALKDKFSAHDLVKSDSAELRDLGASLVRRFWSSEFPRRYFEHTGCEPMLLYQFCTIRHQPMHYTTNYVSWHLDANFYGFSVPLWTIWVPFVPVGVDSPGLEFSIPSNGSAADEGRIVEYWRARTRNEDGRLVIYDNDLNDFHGGAEFEIVTKHLNPGDAFVFDQFVLHRTQVLATASKSRLAIEYRIAPAAQFPPSLDLETFRQTLVSLRQENGDIVIRKMGKHFSE